MTKDLYISKIFRGRIKESLFITLIILVHLLILLHVSSLTSSRESKINPKCFWLVVSCNLVTPMKGNFHCRVL